MTWQDERDVDCLRILREAELPEKPTVKNILTLLQKAWQDGWETGIGQRRVRK